MELDLNKLERLANAATPGPWSWTNNEGWAYPQTQVKTEQGTHIARFVDAAPQFCCTVGEARQEWLNAAFIAAANPAVVLELVRRLREEEGHVTAHIDEAVEAEREACAKVCVSEGVTDDERMAGQMFACEIRARGES